MGFTQNQLLNALGIADDILVLEAALVQNGLTKLFPGVIMLPTDMPEMDNFKAGYVSFKYMPELDRSHFLRDVRGTRMKTPDAERAIVDYYRDSAHHVEEHLLQAFFDYQEQHRGDLTRLYEVAAFYCVSREEIDAMVKESFTLLEET